MLDDNKIVAQKLLQAIGGTPKVIEYKDCNNKNIIDVFISDNKPFDGITSYSTIGLSDHSIGLVGSGNKELRVEFIGVCDSNYDMFANIVGSCAFNIINEHFSCKPGTVYPNLINKYYNNLQMKHIFFTTPFLWDGIRGIETLTKHITWLMLIPISDDEFEFLQTHSSDELENLFEKYEVDIFDLDRKSIV